MNTKAVYTAILGGYDNLRAPSYVTAGWDYICFTDDPSLKSDFWKVVPVDKEALKSQGAESIDNPRRFGKFFKMFPHVVLPEYKESLWVDANVEIAGNIDEFVSRYLRDSDMLCFAHPVRNCAYEEANEVIKLGWALKDVTEKQMTRYQNEGFPEYYGLATCCILYRKHTERMAAHHALWYKETMSGASRDQLSFNYCCFKMDFKYDACNLDCRNNPYFLRKNHKKSYNVLRYSLFSETPSKSFSEETAVYSQIGFPDDIISIYVSLDDINEPIKRVRLDFDTGYISFKINKAVFTDETDKEWRMECSGTNAVREENGCYIFEKNAPCMYFSCPETGGVKIKEFRIEGAVKLLENIDRMSEFINFLRNSAAKIVFYGVSPISKRVSDILTDFNIDVDYFADTYKHGSEFYGRSVLSPQELALADKREPLYVLITSINSEVAIYKSLKKLGLRGQIMMLPLYIFHLWSADDEAKPSPREYGEYVRVTNVFGKKRALNNIFFMVPPTIESGNYTFSLERDYDSVMQYIMRDSGKLISSVLMRSFMTSCIYQKYAPENVALYITTDLNQHDSIIILDKSYRNSPEIIYQLKNNNNIVLLDILDGGIEPAACNLSDGVIFSSIKGFKHYSSLCTTAERLNENIFFINHCCDIRLYNKKIRIRNTDSLSAYYWGNKENIYINDEISKKVNILYTSKNNHAKNDWLTQIENANLHYAVRRPWMEQGLLPFYKPFTKGFNAAHSGANILVHKDDGDAEFFLTKEYPYLIHEPLSGSVVARYMDKCEDEFGGGEWSRGLEIMSDIREATSHKKLSEQFFSTIKFFL